jgi:DNA recombination protein RmuC
VAGATIERMDVATVLIALVMLAAGLAIGWLWAVARLREASERERVELSARHVGLQTELARTQAILDAERGATRNRELEQSQADERLRDAFGMLSAEALQRNNEAFVAMAEARLGTAKQAADGDLAARQLAIETMVTPLRATLDRVQEQLQLVERSRAGSQATLMEQIGTMRATSEQLRTETAQLVTALRAPQVRGRWGEMQLERAVEAAGMTQQIDYVTQVSSTTDEGTLRPDMVVKLVGGKNVVVDSKVAFAGYLEAMEAKDEATRAARLKAHARHLRDHIDSLAAKAYWERFAPSPEFVVCFVPADAFLDAALREDPSLLEHAFARDIVVATPSTLVALLRTVAYTWRQDALAENAAEVHQLGRELYQRLSTMGGHIDKLGSALGSAVGSYNRTVASLESRVLVTARKMTELKVVGPGETIEPPRQITDFARSTQAPELTSERVVALAKPKKTPDQGLLIDPTGTTGM